MRHHPEKKTTEMMWDASWNLNAKRNDGFFFASRRKYFSAEFFYSFMELGKIQRFSVV